MSISLCLSIGRLILNRLKEQSVGALIHNHPYRGPSLSLSLEDGS